MKALPIQLLETLMDCHEKELQHLEPLFGTACMQNVRGLVKRKFLDARLQPCKTTGKLKMSFFITAAGKQYLVEYMNKQTTDNGRQATF